VVDVMTKKIVIDCGHGGSNTGAICPFDPSVLEKDLNLNFCILLNEWINNCRPLDCASTLTRSGDVNLSLEARGLMAEGADLYISIHHNANVSSIAYGFESYVLPNQPIAYAIAKQIQASVPRALWRKRDPILADVANGEWRERPINVMKNVSCQSVLLELGFVTNFNDVKALQTDKIKNGLCAAIMTGLAML
jgi:N-acetylmuramoyl-L-alanine amidase